MTAAIPWLPKDVLEPRRLKPAIEGIVADWSRHWFADAALNVSASFQDEWPRGGAWRSFPELASLEVNDSALAILAGMMLGARVPAGPLAGNDRRLVDGIALEAANDLVLRVAACGGVSASRGQLSSEPIDFAGCSWWQLKTTGGKTLCRLALSKAAAVGMVRGGGLERSTRVRLSRRQDALSAQEIAVSASLGRCALRLSDLHGLAAGDVLVLDRSLDSGLGLLVNARATSLRALLEPDGDTPRLTLLAKQDG